MSLTPTLSNPAFGARVAPLVDTGVLSLSDVHTVDRLGRLANESDTDVLAALAFAVRAPRLGHTGVRLLQIGGLSAAAACAWPEDLEGWATRVASSPLVASGAAGPFVFDGGLLQLTRMATYEGRLAAGLRARASYLPRESLDVRSLAGVLDGLFPGVPADDPQKLAAALSVLSRTTIISGGPGTGKTTTIRKVLLALYAESQRNGVEAPRVALAAPTGKAAARMRQSLCSRKDADADPAWDAGWAWLKTLPAVTLHRLLGWQPRTPSRYRHGPENPLAADVVVVDEASMVDVAMMCKLVEAVAPNARLVLLGDRNQLASVEAGCALADITAGTGSSGIRLPTAAADRIAEVLGSAAVKGRGSSDAPAIGGGMVHFTTAFRFTNKALEAPIYALADASNVADADAPPHLARALEGLLRSGDPSVEHVPHGPGGLDANVLKRIVHAYAAVLKPLVSDPRSVGVQGEALRQIDALRVLAAHRKGTFGVEGLNATIVAALKALLPDTPQHGPWWVGRVVLVTENDYEHGLWNGDIGIATRDAEGWAVVFPAEVASGVKRVAVTSMPAHETAFAMTIHKSQGSQFEHAYVVLPERGTQLLTRELVYTGISRAQGRLTLCGSADVLKSALDVRVVRATSLQARLWGADGAVASSASASTPVGA